MPTCSKQNSFFACDPAEFAECDLFHKTEEAIIENGNERMKIETSFYYSNWGYACHRGEIRSESRNGSLLPWFKSDAELDLEVDANWNNLVCDFILHRDDGAHCDDCSSRSRIVRFASKTVSHCADDLVGDYRKERGTTVIDEAQNVVFDCCP